MRALRILTPASYAVIRRLARGPATTGELIAAQAALKDGRKVHAQERLPDTLSRAGILEPVLRDRGQGRQNMWGLTPKGRAALAMQARRRAAEVFSVHTLPRVSSIFELGSVVNRD